MNNIKYIKLKHVITISIVFLMVSTTFVGLVIAEKTSDFHIEGFDKGPSYTNVVPLKKVTMINYDPDSFLDDYAYLASVPTAVFKNNNKLYSNPLLFYQDELEIEEEKEKSLDAKQGINYFMEDWMGYCNNEMNQKTLINIPENNTIDWKSKKTTAINSDNPYELASKIALEEWSYSNDAVIVPIEENYGKSNKKTNGSIEGTLHAKKIKTENFEVPQTNKINPQFKEFNVPEGYKYIKAHAWWASINFDLSTYTHIIIPSGDKDLQLYCKDEKRDEWMQVASGALCNVQFGMDPKAEYIESYVYNNGQWRASVTDLPTKKIFNTYGTPREIISNILKQVMYQVDIKMYPGITVDIPDKPFYGSGNCNITLTWDNPSAKLGFSLLGPGGEEILSASNESHTDFQEIKIERLGECLEGETYSICVFSMKDTIEEVDFEIEYEWEQITTEEKGYALTSATEGAVLASQLNAPLLYISKDNIPDFTKSALYTLGIENTYIIDIGKKINQNILDEIRGIGRLKKHYTNLKDVYNDIKEKTDNNDVIFSTLNPWTKWYIGELKPAGDHKEGLFIGPAAYIAAHHGSPVLIVDNHPRLSSSVMWHTEFWKRYADARDDYLPTVSEMYLTGMRVYDFLKDYDFDEEGEETIITVAGQFDIGTTWDRVFPGRANPGRFWGSPTDTSVSISRNMFYPALIFQNPAMDDDGIRLINGSKSIRKFPWYGNLGLKIVKPSQEEIFKYPVLQTYVCYGHRLNEMFEKYYGAKYHFADQKIPGETISFNPIDDGVNLKYRNEEGSFIPDIIDSEITPLYASRGGYSNAFSTSFDAVMNNLNEGSIMWIHDGHGYCLNSGGGIFWDAKSEESKLPRFAAAKKEENPWRLYEWYLGSTENPDTMTMDIHGVVPALLGNPNMDGLLRTGIDWAPAYKPIMNIFAKIANLPVLRLITPEWLKDTEDYYDGMVNTVMFSGKGARTYWGYDIDEALDNIHSCGYITANCLSANTYYHLALMRHGSPYQIIDPWSTSWYSSAWIQSIPRDLALGHTIGEAYVNGIKHVGILYISDPPQWWWDIAENVCFYGDPDLRAFVPGTEYSDANYWEKEETKPLSYDKKTDINGHMPFGATEYPNQKMPSIILDWNIIIIALMIIVFIAIIFVLKRSSKNKK